MDNGGAAIMVSPCQALSHRVCFSYRVLRLGNALCRCIDLPQSLEPSRFYFYSRHRPDGIYSALFYLLARFDRTAYRQRNRIKRLINRLKQSCRIATRYKKRAVNYHAMVTISMIKLWL